MSDEAMWWITLGVGLVVAVVLVVLLQVFLNQVRRVERAADDVWTAGKRLAGNTSTTWMLQQLPQRLERVADGLGDGAPAGGRTGARGGRGR